MHLAVLPQAALLPFFLHASFRCHSFIIPFFLFLFLCGFLLGVLFPPLPLSSPLFFLHRFLLCEPQDPGVDFGWKFYNSRKEPDLAKVAKRGFHSPTEAAFRTFAVGEWGLHKLQRAFFFLRSLANTANVYFLKEDAASSMQQRICMNIESTPLCQRDDVLTRYCCLVF